MGLDAERSWRCWSGTGELRGGRGVRHGAARLGAQDVDVDVVPETTWQNLVRLSRALTELRARVRTESEPEGLAFDTSAESLSGVRMLDMVTPHGEVDLTFQPSGTDGYPDLARAAVLMAVGAVEVRIASLADVIWSKTAAGRGKDFAVLPELHRLAGATPAGSTPAGSTSVGGTEASRPPARGATRCGALRSCQGVMGGAWTASTSGWCVWAGTTAASVLCKATGASSTGLGCRRRGRVVACAGW